MPTGPQHQPGADLNHQMIEALLPGYSNHPRDAAVNHILWSEALLGHVTVPFQTQGTSFASLKRHRSLQ